MVGRIEQQSVGKQREQKKRKSEKSRFITTSEPALDDWRSDTCEQQRKISCGLAGSRNRKTRCRDSV
ncbi:uncharacterized protein LAESUDRAFT_378092 [Laetiporus sulphureus 93-53]|uniref:Uncharacterized protein n=1 Tax=Laetiporus sulphureus 93-53 TaxID=1314785 RepID=A0A165CQ54_9APHY|nr:uncharacterized protein LAESUDRAFT_378092 [Laetiporus sulphureus 93-53]KZT03218.1 hypothetical protein LAESUDRAFT_378092 [Laetiporus sulphureus 93-53]